MKIRNRGTGEAAEVSDPAVEEALRLLAEAARRELDLTMLSSSLLPKSGGHYLPKRARPTGFDFPDAIPVLKRLQIKGVDAWLALVKSRTA